jgi:hypothetical protein
MSWELRWGGFGLWLTFCDNGRHFGSCLHLYRFLQEEEEVVYVGCATVGLLGYYDDMSCVRSSLMAALISGLDPALTECPTAKDSKCGLFSGRPMRRSEVLWSTTFLYFFNSCG